MLEVRVSCAKDAGELLDKVPSALAVTLEIASPVDMKIYDEMKARIRPVVRVQPKAGGSPPK